MCTSIAKDTELNQVFLQLRAIYHVEYYLKKLSTFRLQMCHQNFYLFGANNNVLVHLKLRCE
jgi:hypothetical protein